MGKNAADDVLTCRVFRFHAAARHFYDNFANLSTWPNSTANGTAKSKNLRAFGKLAQFMADFCLLKKEARRLTCSRSLLSWSAASVNFKSIITSNESEDRVLRDD